MNMTKLIVVFLWLTVSLSFAKTNFDILITIKQSKVFINDIDGLSSNQSLIYLLYTYDEPYQLVKLNTSTMLPINRCILPYHYNDTTFRQDFFLLPYTDDMIFIGFIQDEYQSEGATVLQGIDLKSMTVNENGKQIFPFKTFTNFIWAQSIPDRQKILVNLWQWDLTNNELTKPRITRGQLPSTALYDTWLLPSLSSSEPPQLLLLYDDYVVFNLNISSSTDWIVNEKLSHVTLSFLSRALSFHMDIVNTTTIAVVDDETNVYIYNLYDQQLTLTLNLRELFPDYPRMSEQIPNNLRANEQFIFVTSSTNAEPNDNQYLFRIDLNEIGKNIELIMFTDENFGLTELISSNDTVYSFERLYEAEDYFNIYKIGTPTKNLSMTV